MAPIKTHKDLEVWKTSVEFVSKLYRITSSFPKEETFGIVSQIRRAGVSVPANIAEGFGRNTTGELKQFIGIAKGSLSEVETLIEISCNLNYIDIKVKSELTGTISKIFRMLVGLKASLK
ncbi:MAG: four helix bundle protein [Bacteroidales bacterium]|nr:four helix bundle protein [Bacteroidales bacterium]MDD4673861.1 four helix bundle protein [Bacteroidales bacterium]